MSVRARVFLLLLVLSVTPLIAMRLNGQIAVERLARELIQQTSRTLVAKAKAHMLLMVQDHAQLWRVQGELLLSALKLQTVEVERALARGERDLARAYSHSAPRDASLLLGQLTAFTDGRVSVSSDAVRLPRQFEARNAVWYKLALQENGPVWTAPVVDPVTRRIGLTLSAPVRDAAGAVAGVTALMAPFSLGEMSREHMKGISPRSRSFLVDFSPDDDEGRGLMIIGEADSEEAREDPAAQHGHAQHMGRGSTGRLSGMMGLSTPRWITPDDPIDLSLIAGELRKGGSGVRQAEYGGRDYLWAYAPSGIKNTALLLIAPKRDAAADAARASEAIAAMFHDQLSGMLSILVAVLLVVMAAAWLTARSITNPVRALSRAAVRLGRGDFSVRVEPTGGREMRELTQAFNDMVPQLRDRTRLQQAMALAQEVHRSLLPAAMPHLPGLDLAAVSISFAEAGGDSYDALPGVHGDPGRHALLVGDVSGHGIDAALLMATARALLRMRAGMPGAPQDVVRDVNRYLAQDTAGTGRFMTLFYLELDTAGRALHWVRAGHDPAILYRAATDDFEELAGPGIPLAALDDHPFQARTRPWPGPGDVLLLGSDGMWEARGPDGGMFGKERVRRVLRENAARSAQDILNALLAALRAFQGSAPQEDDVTLMVIKAQPGTEDA